MFANAGIYKPCGIFTKGHFILILATVLGIFVALKHSVGMTKEKVYKVIKKLTITMCIIEIFKIIYSISKNSLYVVAKYALGKGKKPECLESIKVKMKNPWTIRINVKEKKIIGYVKKGEKYSCFDQDGLVVNVSDVQIEKPVLSDVRLHIPQNLITMQPHRYPDV